MFSSVLRIDDDDEDDGSTGDDDENGGSGDSDDMAGIMRRNTSAWKCFNLPAATSSAIHWCNKSTCESNIPAAFARDTTVTSSAKVSPPGNGPLTATVLLRSARSCSIVILLPLVMSIIEVSGGTIDDDTDGSVPGDTDNGGGADVGGDRSRTNLSSESSGVTRSSCN